MIVFSDTTINKKLQSLKFTDYDAYFFGENHNSELVSKKENLLINYIQSISTIFVEAPVNFNYAFKECMEKQPNDTTESFKSYSGENLATENLLRYLYVANLSKASDNKFKIAAIDYIYFDAFAPDRLLELLSKPHKPKSVKTSYKYLKQIKRKRSRFRDEIALINQYNLIMTNFYSNESQYKLYLKTYFSEFKTNIDGFYIYTQALKEDTICSGCLTKTRENFMFKNITDVIAQEKTKKFISINGAFHIFLEKQQKLEHVKDWESLATNFKKNNPEVKVCSVYFLDRNIYEYGDEYFPKEKKYILENVKPGETYLIRLDGENTPFADLSSKFQYIVVW